MDDYKKYNHEIDTEETKSNYGQLDLDLIQQHKPQSETLNNIQLKLKKSETANSEYKHKIMNLQKELDTTTTAVLRQEIRELQHQNKQYKSELDDYKQTNQTLNTKLSIVSQELDTVSHDYNKLLNEKKELQQHLHDVKQRHSGLYEFTEQQKKEFTHCKQTMQQLNTKLSHNDINHKKQIKIYDTQMQNISKAFYWMAKRTVLSSNHQMTVMMSSKPIAPSKTNKTTSKENSDRLNIAKNKNRNKNSKTKTKPKTKKANTKSQSNTTNELGQQTRTKTKFNSRQVDTRRKGSNNGGGTTSLNQNRKRKLTTGVNEAAAADGHSKHKKRKITVRKTLVKPKTRLGVGTGTGTNRSHK